MERNRQTQETFRILPDEEVMGLDDERYTAYVRNLFVNIISTSSSISQGLIQDYLYHERAADRPPISVLKTDAAEYTLTKDISDFMGPRLNLVISARELTPASRHRWLVISNSHVGYLDRAMDGDDLRRYAFPEYHNFATTDINDVPAMKKEMLSMLREFQQVLQDKESPTSSQRCV